jgi:hypothetical protein
MLKVYVRNFFLNPSYKINIIECVGIKHILRELKRRLPFPEYNSFIITLPLEQSNASNQSTASIQPGRLQGAEGDCVASRRQF